MAQIFNTVSIVSFSLAGVCLILAVFFWFKFDIWKVINDLSGRTAKRSIEQMRMTNELSGKKSYRPTPVAKKRGKLTEPIIKTEKPEPQIEQMSGEDTQALKYSDYGTEILEPGINTQEKESVNAKSQDAEAFEILQSIVMLHTDEVI